MGGQPPQDGAVLFFQMLRFNSEAVEKPCFEVSEGLVLGLIPLSNLNLLSI